VPTLIDSAVPGAAATLRTEIEALGLGVNEIRRIILTHWHLDHIGNAQELRRMSGAEVHLPATDAPYARGESASGPPPVRLLNALMRRRMRYGPPDPVLPLMDGEIVGGFTVVETPGHTPGHVCLLRDGVLFAADALVTGETFRPTPRFLNADSARAKDSIRRLLELEFHTAVSGHGRPAGDAKTKLEDLAGRL
jgi:glyoxylase-like metal-dependent hydrolase (beta-lactamase superfamily II)